MPYADSDNQKRYQKKWYQDNKIALRNRKDSCRKALRTIVNEYKLFIGCKDCGYKTYAEVLEFDHITSDKNGGISEMTAKLAKWSDILVEIQKCEVVCANCHRVRHLHRSKLPV